jgi:hypothetical protein
MRNGCGAIWRFTDQNYLRAVLNLRGETAVLEFVPLTDSVGSQIPDSSLLAIPCVPVGEEAQRGKQMIIVLSLCFL